MFIWNEEKRQYFTESGEPVTDADLRRWVDDFAAALIVLFMGRARRVLDTLLTIQTDEQAFRDALSDWQLKTALDIKSGHLIACVIAFGGFNFIRENEYRTGEQAANFHFAFWENFVTGVFLGTILIDNNFAPRTGMYGAGVFSTFQNSIRARELAAGKTQERRFLGASDHCPTCINQAALKWQPIGSLKAIGDSECKSRCRCYFQFRQIKLLCKEMSNYTLRAAITARVGIAPVLSAKKTSGICASA